MSGQDWSIKIVEMPGGGAGFQPDLANSQPGDPLQAESSDLISWNNRTSETHQPWPTDNQYNPLPESQIVYNNLNPQNLNPAPVPNYLSDPIPPRSPSNPAFTTSINTSAVQHIYYCCRNHPNEHGLIIVAQGLTS